MASFFSPSTCTEGKWRCTKQNCSETCDAGMFWNECADCASTCNNMHVTCPQSSCKTQVQSADSGLVAEGPNACTEGVQSVDSGPVFDGQSRKFSHEMFFPRRMVKTRKTCFFLVHFVWDRESFQWRQLNSFCFGRSSASTYCFERKTSKSCVQNKNETHCANYWCPILSLHVTCAKKNMKYIVAISGVPFFPHVFWCPLVSRLYRLMNWNFMRFSNTAPFGVFRLVLVHRTKCWMRRLDSACCPSSVRVTSRGRRSAKTKACGTAATTGKLVAQEFTPNSTYFGSGRNILTLIIKAKI